MSFNYRERWRERKKERERERARARERENDPILFLSLILLIALFIGKLFLSLYQVDLIRHYQIKPLPRSEVTLGYAFGT